MVHVIAVIRVRVAVFVGAVCEEVVCMVETVNDEGVFDVKDGDCAVRQRPAPASIGVFSKQAVAKCRGAANGDKKVFTCVVCRDGYESM